MKTHVRTSYLLQGQYSIFFNVSQNFVNHDQKFKFLEYTIPVSRIRIDPGQTIIKGLLSIESVILDTSPITLKMKTPFLLTKALNPFV